MNNGIEKVRGKFRVTRKILTRGLVKNDAGEWENGNHVTVEFGALYSENTEDNQYASATPSGKIEMQVTVPRVGDFFDLDRSYYVDFTPVPS